jgi:hypothetical protein
MSRLLLPAMVAAVCTAVVSTQPPQQAPLRWYKGNTHAHTLQSDGDSTPEVVTRWYREHGYQFLVLSDHNVLTPVESLNERFAVPDVFTLIRGEEVTNRTPEGKAVHVNGLDTRARIGPQAGRTILELLQRSVDAIRREGGVPHINHPNFVWSISADELRQVKNNTLFEIYNGHPMVNNVGGGGVPGTEAAWDAILTSGTLLYGIAVDDAHNFTEPGNPNVAGPGRGWVVVRASALQPRAILEAMEHGDFYASTGVELTDVQATRSSLTVTVKKDSWAKYRIQFVGSSGRLLHEALDSPATYSFKGGEGYVRARVLESNGRVAWVQPVLVR